MKVLFRSLTLAALFAASACSNEIINEIEEIDPSSKTAISFSVEENHTPMTRAGFTADTKIAMRIKSENGTAAKYTRTVATASAAAQGKEYSNITIDDDDVRYWDDAFGRSAKLSVYAIAVPQKSSVTNNGKTVEQKLTTGTGTWFTETTENEKINWTVSTEQTAETLANEDLTYSNNIRDGGLDGVYSYDFTNEKYPDYSTNLADGQMQFRLRDNGDVTGPGKFDKGHLIFNHALSRITVNLKKGEGFSGDGSFQFATGTNVQVLSVPVSGSLDLSTGTWSGVTNNTIAKMVSLTPAAGVAYSLMAQILPDYEISKTSVTNLLSFTIDNNTYYITQAQMYDALKNAVTNDGTKITMAQGSNYIFQITVNKTQIANVTAVVEPWVDVTSAVWEPSNARITLNSIYDSQSGDPSTNFDLYRLLDESPTISDSYVGTNWDGDYTDKASSLTDNGNGGWDTDWYFDNNKSYYHFRTVNKDTAVVTSAAQDYFEIHAGPEASTDPHWGAPMTQEPVYDVAKGYEDALSPAIGATKSNINITDQHMLSKVIVNLQTTDGADQVDFTGSKVYITQIHKEGQVQMGNGLITPTGTPGQLTMDGNAAGTQFTYAVVPQALVRGSNDDDYVGITIVTGDNNQYYIVKKLSEILATTVTNEKNQTQGAAIERWYPGHTYEYTFTLKKAKIDKITCTVQGWVNVVADNKEISLED